MIYFIVHGGLLVIFILVLFLTHKAFQYRETEKISEIKREERQKMLELIKAQIKDGDHGGDGCDQNAVRNGLVLASNIIFSQGV